MFLGLAIFGNGRDRRLGTLHFEHSWTARAVLGRRSAEIAGVRQEEAWTCALDAVQLALNQNCRHFMTVSNYHIEVAEFFRFFAPWC